MKDTFPQKQSIRFQTLHHGQDQRAVQGCHGQDCRPTQGWNGLQDHRQAAWWEQLVRLYAMKDWNPAASARSPCSRKHMNRPVWSLSMIQRTTGWKCCGQMRPKSSSLASTQLTVFGGGGMQPMTPRTPSPPSNMEVETLCFGGVFLLRRQYNCTASKGRWTDHVPSGQGHWKWVVDGYSSMTMTQNTRPRQQRSGSRRSTLRTWSGLASLQTFIP